MHTSEKDELTVDPASLRTLSRDLATVSHRIGGISQQIQALSDRIDLPGALSAAYIPAALHSACASWAAILAEHAARVTHLSNTSDELAAGFENADHNISTAFKTINENAISHACTSQPSITVGGK